MKNRPIQARRPPVQGTKRVMCMVRERATGREVTKAVGRMTAKWMAQARARENALWRLKRKKGQRYDVKLHELVYITG